MVSKKRIKQISKSIYDHLYYHLQNQVSAEIKRNKIPVQDQEEFSMRIFDNIVNTFLEANEDNDYNTTTDDKYFRDIRPYAFKRKK